MRQLTIGDKPHKVKKQCPGRDGKPCGRGCYGDICSACKCKDKAIVMKRTEAIMAARAKGMANKLCFDFGAFQVVRHAEGEIGFITHVVGEKPIPLIGMEVLETITRRPGTYDWYKDCELVGRTQSHNILDDMPVLSKSAEVRIESVREILERNK